RDSPGSPWGLSWGVSIRVLSTCGNNECLKQAQNGGEALAEALKVNNTLSQLDLGYNEITDRGGEALAEALK
ncbi:unnamed protein product, partial [Didymodactylos carnosus]